MDGDNLTLLVRSDGPFGLQIIHSLATGRTIWSHDEKVLGFKGYVSFEEPAEVSLDPVTAPIPPIMVSGLNKRKVKGKRPNRASGSRGRVNGRRSTWMKERTIPKHQAFQRDQHCFRHSDDSALSRSSRKRVKGRNKKRKKRATK
jgi:hypothetical protein